MPSIRLSTACPWRIPEHDRNQAFVSPGTIAGNGDFFVLVGHFMVTAFRLAKPGGPRSVLAESVLVRQQPESRAHASPQLACRRSLHRRGIHRWRHEAILFNMAYRGFRVG